MPVVAPFTSAVLPFRSVIACSPLLLEKWLIGRRCELRECRGIVGGELLVRTGPAPEDGLHVVADPLGVALGGQTERLGVLLGDRLGHTGTDHCVLVVIEAEFAVGDGPTEQP